MRRCLRLDILHGQACSTIHPATFYVTTDLAPFHPRVVLIYSRPRRDSAYLLLSPPFPYVALAALPRPIPIVLFSPLGCVSLCRGRFYVCCLVVVSFAMVLGGANLIPVHKGEQRGGVTHQCTFWVYVS